jgi:putative membrane protein insertion efficiency factor
MIQQALILCIKAYRLILSPWLGSACRFTPTCSVFALNALEIHGAGKGSYLTLKRLSRCHPWCDGGEDPVPAIFSFVTKNESLPSPETIAHKP